MPRASAVTEKKKNKTSGAERRAVRRDIPALKQIADACPLLVAEWKKAGGDPYKWEGQDDDDELFSRVFMDRTGVYELTLSHTGIESVPDAVGDLRSLTSLALVDCVYLKTVPDAVMLRLPLLIEISLTGCSRLVALPDSIGALTDLQVLTLNGCTSLRKLPETITRLSSLVELNLCDCAGLIALPDAIGDGELKELSYLDMEGCSGLMMIPASIKGLPALRTLDLRSTSLTWLPPEICCIESLKTLIVKDCPHLRLPAAIDTIHGLKIVTYDADGKEVSDTVSRYASSLAEGYAAVCTKNRRSLARRKCAWCGKQAAIEKPPSKCCARCFGQTRYCSAECQKKHWEGGHRECCSLIRRQRRRTCDVCGCQVRDDQLPFPVCGACGARRYCGEECQRWDWETGRHAQKCGTR